MRRIWPFLLSTALLASAGCTPTPARTAFAPHANPRPTEPTYRALRGSVAELRLDTRQVPPSALASAGLRMERTYADGRVFVAAQVVSIPTDGRVRFLLPASTPPGDYELRLADRTFAVNSGFMSARVQVAEEDPKEAVMGADGGPLLAPGKAISLPFRPDELRGVAIGQWFTGALHEVQDTASLQGFHRALSNLRGLKPHRRQVAMPYPGYQAVMTMKDGRRLFVELEDNDIVLLGNRPSHGGALRAWFERHAPAARPESTWEGGNVNLLYFLNATEFRVYEGTGPATTKGTVLSREFALRFLRHLVMGTPNGLVSEPSGPAATDPELGRPLGRWVLTVGGKPYEFHPYEQGFFVMGRWFNSPALEQTYKGLFHH